MDKKVKVNASILIIGNEILSGRTQDTNSNFIAKHLIKSGIELKEIIVIQDIEARIIEEVSRFSKIYTYVFTTGGIGPTHDEITSDCIAKAFDCQIDINEDARNKLEA